MQSFQLSFIAIALYSYILKQKRNVDFHGTVSFDPVKMSQQKQNLNVYQTSDTQKLVFF